MTTNSQSSDRRSRRILKLSELLKREREAQGLSTRAFARELGISRPYYSRLERGFYGNPSALVLYRVARRLGISMDHLCAFLDESADAGAPGIAGYARACHPNWPDTAIGELEGYYRSLIERYGIS
jgi:transcriptional regulator with XRE-family HTH domain